MISTAYGMYYIEMLIFVCWIRDILYGSLTEKQVGKSQLGKPTYVYHLLFQGHEKR